MDAYTFMFLTAFFFTFLFVTGALCIWHQAHSKREEVLKASIIELAKALKRLQRQQDTILANQLHLNDRTNDNDLINRFWSGGFNA